MRKIVKKFTRILLLAVMVLSELINPISVLADEINNITPNKGDVGINQTVTYDENGKNSTTVSAGSLTNEGDISVTKTVSHATDKDGNVIDGRYKIEFNVKGKDIIDSTQTTKPVYVVIVFDRSGSMKEYDYVCTRYVTYGDRKDCVDYDYKEVKFSTAVAGAKTFASTLLEKIPSANIALVTFAKNAVVSRNFNDTTVNANLSNAVFGLPNEGTNLHAGLKKANELLSAVSDDARKYVVVISDGEPTYYVKSDNSVGGTGGSTSKDILDATLAEANSIKSKTVNGISIPNAEIFTIGYELPTEPVYNDTYNGNSYGEITAEDILTMVASPDTAEDIENGINHYMDSDPEAIANAFTNIATSISRNPAGTNATLTDNLGSNFKVVGAEDNTFTISEITESGTTVSFEVEVDQSKVTEAGWYNTNEGFTLTYTDSNGNTNAKVEYSKEENQPQVWLTPNMYEYTVNYYKDSFENNTFKSDIFEVSNGTTINSVEVNKYLNNTEYNTVGYEYNTVNGLPVTIDSNGKEINVLYTIKKFDYIVNFYYDGRLESTIPVSNIEYGTVVNANDYHDDGEREGYGLDNINTTSGNITINQNDIVIDVYYKKNNYNYIVNYHFNNVIDNDFTKNNNALFGSTIKAEDNYLENNIEDNTKLENKEQNDNTDYFLHPTLDSNKTSITIGTGNNALNLYYISTMVKEDNINDITKTSSIETITSSNASVTYNIDYKNVLLNVKKDSTVKVIIEDILPHEIDITNENTNLNGGVVSSDNKKITWTFETTTEEFKEELDISENFNYTVVYKDVASISSNRDNTLVNTASGTLFVDNKLLSTDRDTASVKVDIKGNLTVKHLEKGTSNELAETENYTGLVGEEYSTNYKTDILGYTVDTTSMPNNANGTYSEEDIEVTYYYVRKNGEIENPTVDKTGPEKVEDVNSTFEYKITASGTVKDYVGKVTLKVTDTLPYEIDKENSTLDNSCKYENDTVTCIKEYNITSEDYTTLENGEKVFNINEEFTLNLKYKNITSETVTNNAKSEIKLDKITDTKEDETETKVEKGKVTAIYVEEGNENNVLAEPETTEGLVGNSYTTEEKEVFGYTLVKDKYPENDKGTYTKEDIIVKYVYARNKGTIEVPTTVKEGPKYVTSVDSIFNYTLKAGTIIKDYVGKVTLKVIDTLPYAVNTNKSKIDNRCSYTGEKEITCTVEYNVTENNFVINETFDLEITYVEITSNKVINNAKSFVILENNKGEETNGSAETLVDEGKVTAIYVEDGNESNKLSSDESSAGLVGNAYTTKEKEIFGYTLVKLPENKEGKYTKEDITVKYVYEKNTGKIENPTIDKKGPEKVEDVNSTFEYKITASGTVKDYVGKVTLKVTDTLPYEIDEENSTLDNSCKYENGVITCIKEYNITSEDYTTLEDGEKVFNINEEFTLNLKYKNITSETLTNNAKSEIILDKVTDTKEDESETKVEKGKVTAIYVEEGNENNVLADSETTEGLVGNLYTTEEKEIFGYTLVEFPENKEGTYTKEDITVKYVYSKNIGTSKEELEKEGTTKVDNINSKFDYTIKYNTTIMDYVGEAKLVIKDILPYEIDTEKSKYSDNCKYINGEIVCTYNKDITKEDNTFIIEEEFELYYINVNKKDVLNRVESVLTYGESEKINNDEFVSEVKEGTVIVNYVTKENGKYVGLADSITLTGPVGTSYTTEKKEFDKYNFIEVIGDVNGEYTDGEIEVTYVYDLTPLPPQTGVETSPFMIMQYIISAFLLFIINRSYKTSKNN